MQSGSGRPKTRPVHGARASGPSAASSVSPRTTVASAASTYLDRFHHTMGEVWLTILAVGDKANQAVVSCGQVSGEGTPRPFIEDGHPTDRLRWGRSLHSLFRPARKI